MGKDWKSCESGEIGHSESFLATPVKKIGKVANQMKLAIPSYSEPLQWEKIGKVANQENWPFQIILSHSGWKRLENLQTRQN